MRLVKDSPEYKEAYELWKSEGEKYEWHFAYEAEKVFEYMDKNPDDEKA